MTHVEIQELLGVYALDALDGDEAEAVARHLDECPRCRAEVADHREVAALLAYAGAPAPDGLWERIAAGLEEPPPALELTRLDRRRLQRRMVSLRAAAVAFTVAAASIIGLGVEVVRLDRRIPSNVGIGRLITEATRNPGVRRASLVSTTSPESVDAIVAPDGFGYVTRVSLRRLPSGQTYQLWGLAGDQLISLGVLGPDPKQQSQFETDVAVSELAITVERAPGVAVTRQQPVVAGQVRV